MTYTPGQSIIAMADKERFFAGEMGLEINQNVKIQEGNNSPKKRPPFFSRIGIGRKVNN